MANPVIHCAGCNTYRRPDRGQKPGPCRCGGTFVVRTAMKRCDVKMPRRATDGEIAGMKVAYESGASLAEVGRLFPRRGKVRNRADVRDYLIQAGTVIRASATATRSKGARNRLLPATPHTDAEIRAMVDKQCRESVRAKGFHVPRELKAEWRGWTMERRQWMISLLREWYPSSMPTGRFSARVEPFNYVSPAANAILKTLNAGLPSRLWKARLFPNSEGVIYEGELWFWCEKAGYQLGIWDAETGRPCLHWRVWEQTHGRVVPAGHVIWHADGNRNNLDPSNLVLAERNDVCRENHVKALNRKARTKTALLLQRNQRSQGKEKPHDLIAKIHDRSNRRANV